MASDSQIRRLSDFNELVDSIEEATVSIDKSFERVRLHVIQNQKVEESCGSCTTAGCCYQSTSVALVDALPIARHLRRIGKSTVEYRAHLRKVGEEMESMSIGQWFDLARPCVFLTEDKKCSIYEHRPRACSGHFVITPSEHCSPPTRKNISTGQMPNQIVTEMMFQLEAAFQSQLGMIMSEPLGGALPKMVAVVLEAMTLPWSEFVAYLDKHARMSKEVVLTVIDDETLKRYTEPTEYVVEKEADAEVPSVVPSDSDG